MTEDARPRSPLVQYLERLAQREDRATLAALRTSLGEERQIDALRVVLPLLGGNIGRQGEDDAALVAGLFATHPVIGPRSLAAALRDVHVKTGSESVEARFRALLSASRNELPTHLRHAVSLVASKNIGIDWDDLYRAIRYWGHDSDFVRRSWARAFWAGNVATDVPAPEGIDSPSAEVLES